MWSPLPCGGSPRRTQTSWSRGRAQREKAKKTARRQPQEPQGPAGNHRTEKNRCPDRQTEYDVEAGAEKDTPLSLSKPVTNANEAEMGGKSAYNGPTQTHCSTTPKKNRQIRHKDRIRTMHNAAHLQANESRSDQASEQQSREQWAPAWPEQ